MPVLGMDTAGRRQSVALAAGGRVVARASIEAPFSHSGTLLESVDLVLSEAHVTPCELTAVAVTCGPGTFTGLRIGMATAKGLALSAGVPLVGRSTLAILASALVEIAEPAPGTMVCALLEAGRGQIYRGLFRVGADLAGKAPPEPIEAGTLREAAEALRDLEEGCLVGGDGLARLEEIKSFRLPSAARCVAQTPLLAPVLALIVDAEERAGPIEIRALVPNYVRGAEAPPPGRA